MPHLSTKHSRDSLHRKPVGSAWTAFDLERFRFITEIVALAEHTDGTIYALRRSNEVLRLAPGSDSWVPLPSFTSPPHFETWTRALTVTPDGTVWVGTEANFVLALDGATPDSPVATSSPSAFVLYFTGGTLAFDGTSWTRRNEGLSITTIPALAADAVGTVWFAAPDVGLFRQEGGTSLYWIYEEGPLRDQTVTHLSGHPVAPAGVIAAATQTDGTAQVWRRAADGTWTQTADLPGDALEFIHLVPSERVYAGLPGAGVYVSPRPGEPWDHVEALPLGDADATAMASVSQRLLVGTSDGRVLTSNDLGASWTNASVADAPVVSIVEHPERGVFAASADSVWRSPDDGLTWSAVSDGLPADTALTTLATWRGYPSVFVGTAGAGVYELSDSETTWTPTAAMGDPRVNDLLILGRVPIAATPSGAAFGIEIIPGGSPNSTDDATPDRSTAQAYPNPFSDRLTVTWPTTPGATGTIEVFDLLGRRVYADEVAPGTGTTTLSGPWLGRLGAGVYVLRILTPTTSTTLRVAKAR